MWGKGVETVVLLVTEKRKGGIEKTKGFLTGKFEPRGGKGGST